MWQPWPAWLAACSAGKANPPGLCTQPLWHESRDCINCISRQVACVTLQVTAGEALRLVCQVAGSRGLSHAAECISSSELASHHQIVLAKVRPSGESTLAAGLRAYDGLVVAPVWLKCKCTPSALLCAAALFSDKPCSNQVLHNPSGSLFFGSRTYAVVVVRHVERDISAALRSHGRDAHGKRVAVGAGHYAQPQRFRGQR